MSEHPTERLSAYIDGELTADERTSVEQHLETCADCQGVLADLRGIVVRARSLEDRPPENDLWTGIEARLEERPVVVPLETHRARRRLSFTLPQMAAAAVALIVLSVSATWWARSGAERGTDAGPPVAAVQPDAATPTQLASLDYDTAVADFEELLAMYRDRLDPQTVATVEASLAVIDEAIDEIVKALDADPESTQLYNYLTSARQRKLDVMRQATSIIRTSI
jgi:anti-sigma factor RsiW